MIINTIGASNMFPGAGAHNAVYRGKYLGPAVTDAQWAAISAGTFDDLYIGDYWTIDGVNYRIAAFDYYYNTGDTACTTHHVTIVPDTCMYNQKMNDTMTDTGAYAGSKIRQSGLNAAKETINNAFGTAHVLKHRTILQNAVSGNAVSGVSWYDSTVELMTEQNVYGCKIFGSCINGTDFSNEYTVGKKQYPLFAYKSECFARENFWLRDFCYTKTFCMVAASGSPSKESSEKELGVRPTFSIC